MLNSVTHKLIITWEILGVCPMKTAPSYNDVSSWSLATSNDLNGKKYLFLKTFVLYNLNTLLCQIMKLFFIHEGSKLPQVLWAYLIFIKNTPDPSSQT